MKKQGIITFFLFLILAFFTIGADWWGWDAGRLIYGEHISTRWTWTDTMRGSADACTSAWFQSSYDADESADSNRLYQQNAPNWFMAYVKLVNLRGPTATISDTATITSARIQMSLSDGGDVYTASDSSQWWIGLSDSLPMVETTTPKTLYRYYPIYLPSGRWFRAITYTTVDDTFEQTITIDGMKQ